MLLSCSIFPRNRPCNKAFLLNNPLGTEQDSVPFHKAVHTFTHHACISSAVRKWAVSLTSRSCSTRQYAP